MGFASGVANGAGERSGGSFRLEVDRGARKRGLEARASFHATENGAPSCNFNFEGSIEGKAAMATSALFTSVSDPPRSGGASPGGSSSPASRSPAFPPDARAFDFSFAYNNPQYGDRVVLLHILESDDEKSSRAGGKLPSEGRGIFPPGRTPPDATEPLKRCSSHPEQLSSAKIELRCGPQTSVRQEGGAKLDTTSSSTHEATQPKIPNSSSFPETSPLDPSRSKEPPRESQLHVLSALLVSQSEFFRSLFSPEWSVRGAPEGDWKTTPVRIKLSADEEKPFLDLIRFIYTGRIMVEDDPRETLRLLLLANKYGVMSCVNVCAHQLREVPLSLDICCVLLRVCSGVVLSEAASFLVASSAAFLVSRFGNLDSTWQSPEFLDLPLEALEAILGSDDLSVTSEETVFLALLHWVRHQCPEDLERRKELLAKLAMKIRFPAMDVEALRSVVMSAPETESPSLQSLVMDALWFKCSSFERQQELVLSSIRQHRRYVRRRQLSIHSEVLLQDCYMLQPGQAILLSGGAWVCGKLFSLKVMRVSVPVGGSDLGLFLQASQRCPTLDKVLDDSVSVEFSFQVKEWPAGIHVQLKQAASHTFKGLFRERGYRSLLPCWNEIMKDNNKYFRNGVMYLRADLRVIHPGESLTPYE